jgi:hypothetical protein
MSRRRTAEVLQALVDVLVKEGGGTEGGPLGSFLPRVRDLAGEVLRVLEMRMEGGTEAGLEEEDEEAKEEEVEEGMEEVKATLTACKRALGCLAGGSASGLEGQGEEKGRKACKSLGSMRQVGHRLSAMRLEAMGIIESSSRHASETPE